ncbi:MarR family transcriptional regulator [Bdellovibrio bacteriovorus]|uniref:MarR family winged helix-turn-helix transcriptional regulator n=1 Tax=Bdellovibrio bacteriovorus TaxID=959 RepID=UPI0021D1C4DD|nr:MarR family transcriptional regulator [Bdellovibrio bacteriovorus]UXR63623.1 MarR family transcriptional regulator [Bdellovibrio bacteriovorus]
MKKPAKPIPHCESTFINPALKVYFGYCLNKAALKYKTMTAQALAHYGIVTPQLGIMKLLQIQGPKSQITLGQEMFIDKASMVKFIDGLEKIKYVRRIPASGDRRIKMVELTPKGQKGLEALVKVQKEMENEFLSPLTAKEKELIKEILPKLLIQQDPT